MDSHEAMKMVRDRISMVEPESVTTKIMQYLELIDIKHVELIRLALGADTFMHSFIQKAKNALYYDISPPISPTMIPSPLSDAPIYNPFSTVSPRQIPSSFRNPPYWDSPLDAHQIHHGGFSLPDEYTLHTQFVNMEKEIEPVKKGNDDYYCSEAVFNHLGIRGSRNAPNLIDYPIKTCHYFKQGFCKHGNNCRYFHGESFPESYPPLFSSKASDSADEDQMLEKLELEITELMKSRKGYPVSIAALPMMYLEKYGRTLRADGYLTESQRHGRPGFSLTKLFAKLKSVRLIERPHGQHAVILAEDAPKYLDIRSERNDPGPIVSGSRQIYLTFPADSTFTEDDVSNYFSSFGPVEDVRIPCQQKRMFGFVTFLSSDTVKAVLSKGNPHYVRGARVLVKPYREKSKLVDRKYQEKFDHQYYNSQHDEFSPPEFQSNPSRWLQNQILQAQEIEHEMILRSKFQLAHKSFARQPSLSYSMDRLKLSQDNPFRSAEDLNYLLDVIGSNNNNCNDHESVHGMNLPESPFASVVANNISAVI